MQRNIEKNVESFKFYIQYNKPLGYIFYLHLVVLVVIFLIKW